MTYERNVLIVVHTGRAEATDTARRVEKVLGANGIGLRVLTAEAVDRGALHLAPDEMRALGVDIDVVDPDEQAADGCELVLALGGDGTFLRAAELGWHTVDVTASPLPGPSGNVEYFLRLRTTTDRPLRDGALTDAVTRAVAEGPQ
jgi:hypothetical protein